MSHNIFSNFILVLNRQVVSDPLHLDMSSMTIFIPKNCKASGATLAIIYDTYQQEKYTCLECTL